MTVNRLDGSSLGYGLQLFQLKKCVRGKQQKALTNHFEGDVYTHFTGKDSKSKIMFSRLFDGRGAHPQSAASFASWNSAAIRVAPSVWRWRRASSSSASLSLKLYFCRRNNNYHYGDETKNGETLPKRKVGMNTGPHREESFRC